MSNPLAKQAFSNSLLASNNPYMLSSSPVSSPYASSSSIPRKPNPYTIKANAKVGTSDAIHNQTWSVKADPRIDAKSKGIRYGTVSQSAIAPKRDDFSVVYICPNCKIDPPHLVEETANGDVVCADCGLVLGDRVVDTRSEWRTFANDDGPDQSRVGQEQQKTVGIEGELGLSTIIGHADSHTGIARALKATQNRMIGSKAASELEKGFLIIDDFAAKIGINKTITDTAKQIYKRVEEIRELNGGKHKIAKSGKKAMEAIAAASIYLACKNGGQSRSMKEIVRVADIEKKDFGGALKSVTTVYQRQLEKKEITRTKESGSALAIELIQRFTNLLGLDPPFPSRAEDIVRSAYKSGKEIVASRSPTSVAGGAINMVRLLWDLPVDMVHIVKVVQVSSGTINLITKILSNFKDEVLRPEWLTPQGGARLDKLPAIGDRNEMDA